MGSLQCRLHYYAKGLQHCQWLEKHGASGKILFFADFAGEYLDSLLPEMELYAIYNVYDRNLDEDFKQSFLQIVDSLRGSNYNLVTSSRQLFVHKNTLAFRVNKIKSIFHSNPFQSSADRAFLEGFCKFLKQKPS